MLIREAIEPSAVVLAGDVMLDCVLWHRERAWKSSRILDTLRLDTKAFVLATVHRSENTDDQHKLGTIVQVLKEARSIGPVVLPVHPRTHRALTEYSLMDRLSRCVTVIEPVGYLDMLVLMESALLVVSDSGGVPKEASFLGTPSLMLRANTEWPELIESGAAVLVEPSSAEVVLAALQGALELRVDNTMKLFGDGNAAIRVVRNLCG